MTWLCIFSNATSLEIAFIRWFLQSMRKIQKGEEETQRAKVFSSGDPPSQKCQEKPL